jgi:hypothetical protein
MKISSKLALFLMGTTLSFSPSCLKATQMCPTDLPVKDFVNALKTAKYLKDSDRYTFQYNSLVWFIESESYKFLTNSVPKQNMVEIKSFDFDTSEDVKAQQKMRCFYTANYYLIYDPDQENATKQFRITYQY